MMNKINLSKKTALVTGSAKGLGAAIVKALARVGAKVVVHYRKSKKEAEKTLAEVKKYSPKSFMVSGDLTKEEEVSRMFSQIFAKVEKVDILINLVGNFIYKPLRQTSFREFKDVWESNLYSLVLCSREVLPKMRKQSWGHIINFGSVGCERILLRPNTTPYYISKTGVYLLTKMMAYEEARYGIRINMISPGVLPTSVIKPARFAGQASQAGEKLADFPAGRQASFEDIINAIFFLLSQQSSYIIGANIEVAGGWSPEL